MNCFPCFQRKDSESNKDQAVPVAQAKDIGQLTQHGDPKPNRSTEVNNKKDDANAVDSSNISAKTFTFRELATATKNFRQECLLSEGGSGRVFKGTLQPSGQVVAVKQLDKNSTQGNKEFLVEVLMLSLLHHPNLLNLIGYCADGDQRLLVYEYLPIGSVADNLLDLKPEKKPLDWITRMKIASGTAEALEYLHEKANPPVIYRDLKSSNIMLDEEFNPKLSDYGLAKLGGNNTHVTPRVMGNYGYCAPEYERSGELTVKSDVYSFGVIILELITGRRALDTSRPTDEQNLVSWAQPFFRDPKSFPEMADPHLQNAFPVKSLNQAVGVAAMCLQDEPAVRPLITDVVAALSFLAVAPPDQPVPATLEAPIDHHSGEGSRSVDAESNNNTHELKGHTHEDRGGSIQPVPIIPLVPTDHHSGDSSSSVVAKSNYNKHESEDHNQEDKGGSDYESGDSYGSSDYEDEDDFAYQQGNNKEGHQQGKVESMSLDYEVASMSESSISGSEDESQLGGINKRCSSNAEVHSGNNSLKLKRKSTKKSHGGSVRSRSGRVSDDESCYGSFGSSSRDSSQRGSARLGSRDGSNMELDNGSVDLSTRQTSSVRSKNRSSGSELDNGSAGLSITQKTSERSKNRSIGSYSRVSSNVKPGKRRVVSAHYGSKEVEEQKL